MTNKKFDKRLLAIPAILVVMGAIWLFSPTETLTGDFSPIAYYNIQKGVLEQSKDQVCNLIFQYVKDEICVSGTYCIREEEFGSADFSKIIYARHYKEYEPQDFQRPTGYSYRDWAIIQEDNKLVVYRNMIDSGLSTNDFAQYPGIRCISVQHTNNFEDIMTYGFGPWRIM